MTDVEKRLEAAKSRLMGKLVRVVNTNGPYTYVGIVDDVTTYEEFVLRTRGRALPSSDDDRIVAHVCEGGWQWVDRDHMTWEVYGE